MYKQDKADSQTTGSNKSDKRKPHSKQYPHMKFEAEPGAKQAHIQVKLEEMITLSILKGTRNTGSVKKMLHAPTLKLYAVKEIPLINREVHGVLKEWINTWQ